MFLLFLFLFPLSFPYPIYSPSPFSLLSLFPSVSYPLFLSLYLQIYPFLFLPVIFPLLNCSPFRFFFFFLSPLHLPCPSSSLSRFPLPFLFSPPTLLPYLSSPSLLPVFPINFFFYSNTVQYMEITLS